MPVKAFTLENTVFDAQLDERELAAVDGEDHWHVSTCLELPACWSIAVSRIQSILVRLDLAALNCAPCY